MASVASPQFKPPARLRRPSIGWVASIALGGGLATPAEGLPLPALPWAGAFLCIAVLQDLTHRRIPNWLTFPAMLGALAMGLAGGGETGLLQALLGLGLTFLILFVPYAARGLGAGDVKACMALGALWGPLVIVPILVWLAAIAGTLAATTLLWEGLRGQRAGPARPALDRSHPTPSRRGLPLAPSIAAAVIAYQQWGTPWHAG